MTIYLGVTGVDIGPVAAILSSIIHCSMMAREKQSPFLCFSDGQVLTRDHFVMVAACGYLSRGIDASAYAGHSFWISAATTVAACGLPE